ncbi:winged helix-turn-helix transcriptional regulator [Rhizobium lusitanum]|uniref:Winged helix-turn-helix transcriptional regulator n=1 Tax=Rhizobium lusitanum TaxID=293958 RepID=A0A6L9U8D3_9HYPH|nr:ROK family transcriptional regulator [Rhizobium lusitanum]NEI71651.1 winged helix-turn-helix transcriptional regulator [Rhizobium lusitanum]
MPPDRAPPAPGLGHAQIADHNSRTILEALRRNGPMTRLELAALTGLTAPGVTNVLRRHLAEGLIVEGQRRTQNAQVPSAEYALRPDGAFAIGLRLRRDRVSGMLVDLDGRIRSRASVPRTNADETAIAAAFEELHAAAGPSANLVGIGLALDDYGADDAQKVRQVFPDRLVVAELDTLAAVLAERTVGAGIPEAGMVMVLLEERIRSGLFLHSIPFAGARGRAGRIGGMLTGPDRLQLDRVCSADAYMAAVENPDGGSAEATAAAWIKKAAVHLFDALMAIAGFVAPGKIVLDGDLPSDVIDALIVAMRCVAASQRPESPPPPLPPVTPATFVGDSVLLGAALLPFFDVLLPKRSVAE